MTSTAKYLGFHLTTSLIGIYNRIYERLPFQQVPTAIQQSSLKFWCLPFAPFSFKTLLEEVVDGPVIVWTADSHTHTQKKRPAKKRL